MRTKNKMVVLMEIAVVLCSLFLVALPVISADQNQTTQEVTVTASEDDCVLGIYGNANEDDTVDMRDVTYTKLVIFGKKPETKLADAYYDDEVDVLDVVQIKLIILGRESELTVVDSADRTVTVKKPVERIVTLTGASVELLRSLDAEERLVGVDTYTMSVTKKDYFPELEGLPTVGTAWTPDCEAILSLEPDVVFTYSTRPAEDYMDDFAGTDIAVMRLDFKIQDYTSEVARLGYVLDEEEKAAEAIDFHQGYMDQISERIDELSEDEKPVVYLEWNPDYMTDTKQSLDQLCRMAGGINIATDLAGMYPTVEAEWVIEQDPDFIVKFPFRSTAAHGYDVDDPSEMATLREDIMDRTGFDCIKAVENGDVYIVGQEIVGGPRTLVAVAYMAKWFHPALFEDLCPNAIHEEYITGFQGLDYDLDEHGVFVYHSVYNPEGR